MENQGLMPFEGQRIRKIWHNDEWYLSVVDVIEVLTNATQPRTYWAKLKKKVNDESELLPIWQQLKLTSSDGKTYKTDCANTEGVLRIIMSIPSPKVEPLKLWMAQVSRERIEESENPELSFDRMTEIYKAQGRSDEWIKERVQSIAARKRLTDEWKERGVKEGHEYGILTATIAKATFGLTPSEHGQLKGLKKQNLRDHMTPLELIFTSLSEEITRQVAIKDDAVGFSQNQEAAAYGGTLAGGARAKLEHDKGINVVSAANFLELAEDKKEELPPSV